MLSSMTKFSSIRVVLTPKSDTTRTALFGAGIQHGLVQSRLDRFSFIFASARGVMIWRGDRQSAVSFVLPTFGKTWFRVAKPSRGQPAV